MGSSRCHGLFDLKVALLAISEFQKSTVCQAGMFRYIGKPAGCGKSDDTGASIHGVRGAGKVMLVTDEACPWGLEFPQHLKQISHWALGHGVGGLVYFCLQR